MKTILIADDDSVIRDVYRLILEFNGFNCLTAENGQEAVEIFKEKGEDIDLTILDMRMPVMTGEIALNEILKLDKQAPVLIISGELGGRTVSEMREAGARDVLMKPMGANDFINAVKSYVH